MIAPPQNCHPERSEGSAVVCRRHKSRGWDASSQDFVRFATIALCIVVLLGGPNATATTCIPGESFKVRQVCGEVKDSQGTSISGAKVEVTKEGESQATFIVGSDSDGKFVISRVPDGDYWLRVTARGFSVAAQAFSVQRSENKHICSNPVRVVMKPAGQCSYVENAWKKKDLR
jgi:hypothetical protein